MIDRAPSVTAERVADEDRLAELADELTMIVQRRDDAEVEAFLDAHPADVDQLRQLLPTMRMVAGFASREPSAERQPLAPTADLHPMAPSTLGDFRILHELGRGGMGVVYLAEQISLDRQVALKILPFAAVMDPRQLQRFKTEVQAAASLVHQNVLPVYSVGCERGVHYYAMQYVEGHTLADVVARLRRHKRDEPQLPTITCGSQQGSVDATITRDLQPSSGEGESDAPIDVDACVAPALPLANPTADTEPLAAISTALSEGDKTQHFRSIARLIVQGAEALDYAHSRGILHRDVKPGNLMVDVAENLWVVDFGLARLEADAGMTMTGDIVGTLRYMSPEQALAKRVVVDQRTDVYSLGATLYELLTLRPAFRGDDRNEILNQIAFDQPRSLRKIDPKIPHELETITFKAMEKDPADRYDTAQDMADDLQRYLDNQPLLARPPSLANQIVKWSRRHVGIVWTLVAACLALAVATSISAALIAGSRIVAEQEREQAEQERTAAIEQRNTARRNQYHAEIVAGQTDVAGQNLGGVYARLINYLPITGESDHRGWEWYYLMSLCRTDIRTLYYPGYSPKVAWSPDGQYIGTGGAIWRAESGEQIRRFNESHIARHRVVWSPDGQKFAWAMADDENAFYIWDRTSDSVRRFAGHESSVWTLAWSPDGSQIASGGMDKLLKIWDVASQAIQWENPTGAYVCDLAWSPDGKLLAMVGRYGQHRIRVWDLSDKKSVFEKRGSAETAVAWNTSGDILAVCAENSWYLLNRDDWSVIQEQKISRGRAIAFSPNGSQIAVTHGETATVWDVGAETKVTDLKGHSRPVLSVSWNPDGRRLVTGDGSREIKLWDLGKITNPIQFDAKTTLESIAWHGDNKTLSTVARDIGSMAWWDATDGSLQRRKNLAVKRPYRLSLDRKLAAVPLKDGRALSIIDASTGTIRSVLRFEPDHTLRSYEFSPDGSRIALQTEADGNLLLSIWEIDREALVWSWKSERAKGKYATASGPLKLLTWSEGSSRIAVVGFGDVGEDGSRYWKDHLHVFDAARGKRMLTHLPRGSESILSLAWSPDERSVALGTPEGRIEVIDAERNASRFSHKIHSEGVCTLAWHPDGNRLACGSLDGKVKLATSDGGNLLLTFSAGSEEINKLSWSNNGQRLAAATNDGGIRIWNAGPAFEITADGPRRGELAWAYLDRAARSTAETKRAAILEFLHLAPDTLGFWESRGTAYARLGEFDRAFDEFSKGVEPDLKHAFSASKTRPLCLLGAGRLERYREVCAQLVEVFRESPVPSNRGNIARVCALAPNHLIDAKLLVKMARFINNRNKKDMTNVLTLGACLYRDGQIAEAAQVLTELSSSIGDASVSAARYELAFAKYFLAMARLDMGHSFQARRMLEEADCLADGFRADELGWEQSLGLKVLRQEATSKIDE
jgi:WD40 repeat protein/serine/threonine protein kinase